MKNKIEYAGFQVRTLANLIDTLIMAIFFVPFFFLLSNIIYGDVSPSEMINQITKQAEQFQALHPGEVINPIAFLQQNQEFNDYFYKHHGFIKFIVNQILQLMMFGGVITYFWIKRQATLGKMALSLKIIDAKTLGKPTNRQLAIRALSYVLSALPLFLGFIWVAFDPKKQGWHDKLAGTLVIRDKKK